MIIKTTFHGLKPYYQIAQQFDNLTAGLEIDCAGVAEPEDTAAVLIRGVDGSSYPALSTYEDGILRYSFTAADLKSPGNIYVQLAIYGPAGEVKHSKLAALHVAQSIPGDEEPPEALKVWLDEATQMLENLKKYGSDAEKSAIAAAASEKNAAEAAEAAYNFASAAALSETSAKSQAEAATTAASQAQSSASSAARDASDANDFAQSAAESASTATTAASTATAKATAAAGSASAAQSAKTAAETARSAAETAKTAAETAQTAAEEARDAAAASATEAAQSAQTATVKAQEIAESADKINAVQKQADRTERSLNALWKLNEGQTYDIEPKEESGMNEAPSGAKYMSPEEVYGKTEQAQTNGYQLLDYQEWKKCGHNGDETYGSAIFENNGVTITALRDDVYTNFSGEPGSHSAIPVNAGEVITISWDADTDTEGKVFIFPNGLTTDMATANNSSVKRLSYTVPDGVTSIRFRFGVKNAGDTIKYSNIMIERGTVVHDWEPYTGGIPAPNPDFPEPIHSVEEIHIKHTGVNLFDAVAGTINSSGIFVPDLGTNTAVSTKDFIPLLSSVVYVSKAKGIETTDMSRFTLMLRWYDKDKTYLKSDVGLYAPDVTAHRTAPNNAKYCRAVFFADVTGTQNIIDTYHPMVSYYDVPNEPYRGETHTIIPPRPLNAIGEYRDTMDIENGEWKYEFSELRKRIAEMNNDEDYPGWVKAGIRNIVGPGATSSYKSDCARNSIYASRSNGAVVWWNTLGNNDICYFSKNSLGYSQSEFKERFPNLTCHVVLKNVNITTEPIAPDDLDFLRSLANTPATDCIIITDQDGNDVPWLNEYIVSLREVANNG